MTRRKLGSWASAIVIGGLVSAACFALMSPWDDDIVQEILAAFLAGTLISAFVVLLAALVHRWLGRSGWRSLLPTAAFSYLVGSAPAVALHISIGLSYFRLDHPGATPGWPDIWMWVRNGLTGTASVMLGLGAAAAVSIYWILARQPIDDTSPSSLDIDS